jgi:hypothetical protein
MADRLRTLDEEIARHLEEAAKSGELKAAKGYGKPPEPDPGWDATPPELRMPFKILKDSGFVPAEVEWFHERAQLRKTLDATVDPAEQEALRKRLVALEQKISLRLEALRGSAKL